MKTISFFKQKKGQALLMLLVFSVIGLLVGSAATTLILVNSSNVQKSQAGLTTLQIAESGMENALIRILRNPNYQGETLTIGQGTATITVTGSGPFTLTSVGSIGNFSRTIQVIADYNNNILTVTSWREVY